VAQWKHTDSPPPKKFRVSASAEKMMVAMFWESEGMILTHCIPKKTKVTGGTYEDVLRTKFLPALREKRPKNVAAVFFHQDNAPPHRAGGSCSPVPHAPYSPDLAPSDFWLFPTLKDTLRGRTFSSRSALATVIFQWSQHTPKEAFAAAMQSWRQRCEKCVRLQGDYVEK
jgi:histone-lysine N-methyltransferase SETMAR